MRIQAGANLDWIRLGASLATRNRYVAAAMNKADSTGRRNTFDKGGVYGTLLAMTGFLTLLLVLMSIERNTRHLRTEREV